MSLSFDLKRIRFGKTEGKVKIYCNDRLVGEYEDEYEYNYEMKKWQSKYTDDYFVEKAVKQNETTVTQLILLQQISAYAL